MNSTLKRLGEACKDFRREQGLLLRNAAFDTNYAIESICAFEHGRTNNALILLWYVNKGLPLETLKGVYNGENK